MNNTKPYWYEVAKGGAFEKTVFTDEMKQEVIRRINTSPGRRLQKYFVAVSAALVMGITLMWMLYDDGFTGFNFTKSTSPQNAESYITTENAVSSDERTLNYQELRESSVDFPRALFERFQLAKVDKSSIIIKDEAAFKGVGKLLSYMKPGEAAMPYFGIELSDLPNAVPGELYEFGTGSMTDVEFVKSNAFGQLYLRLSGVCGPRIVCTNWLSYAGGVPVLEFQINSAIWLHYVDGAPVEEIRRKDSAVSEADLDGDGVIDVVATTSSLFNKKAAFIFRKIGDKIEYVNVNEAIQQEPRDTVIYDPSTRIFQINSDEKIRKYKYAAGKDKLIRMDN